MAKLKMIQPLSKYSWSKFPIILLMVPAILFYLVLGIIPSITTFFYSFTNISGVPGTQWNFIGLSNYTEFFFRQNYRDTFDAIYRSIIFAVSVTIFQNAFALMIALLFNSKVLRWRNFARSIVFLPTMLGITIICFAWSFFFTLDGPAQSMLALFGIKSSGFLGSYSQAFPIVIFVQIWSSVGFAMMIYIAGLQSIPDEIYESASMDGANGFQVFAHITLQMIWPTLMVSVLLSIIGSLGVVQTILLLTGGENNTSTLAMRIFTQAFNIGKAGGNTGAYRQGFAAAQSMVLFLLVLIVTLITQFVLRMNEKER